MDQIQKTHLLVVLIMGLVVGVCVGWVAKPIPPPGPEWVSKADFDKLKSELDTLKGDYSKLKADYNKLKTDYDKLKMEYSEIYEKITSPVSKDFILDLYDRLAKIPAKANLTDEARLLLINHANRVWMRDFRASPSQLKVSLILVYGVAMIEAGEPVDPLFVIGTYEENIVPIIVNVTGREPPRDVSMECVPPHPPNGLYHLIDVIALNDPLVVRTIVDKWPPLKAALEGLLELY